MEREVNIYDRETLFVALADRVMMGMDSRQYGEIIRREGLWEAAMDIAAAGGRSGRESQAGFRAAWSLEAAYFSDREAFRPYAERFLGDFTQVRNPSVHRHYAKMLYDMMKRGLVDLQGTQAGRIAEFCFDLLIGPGVRVAVKGWSTEILVLLAPKVDWVAENLEETLRHQMAGGSPAMIVSTRRAIARLRLLPYGNRPCGGRAVSPPPSRAKR